MKDGILLRFEKFSIPATLYNTVAARDFKRRLPLAISGTRSAEGYRFSAAIGCFDPEETQMGWKNGDISIAGGWLRIFSEGEETSANAAGIMVIAHIREKDLCRIKELPHNVCLKIEAAEQAAGREMH